MTRRYFEWQSFCYDGSVLPPSGCKEGVHGNYAEVPAGSTIRWRGTRFIVVDYADIDAIIARELGKRKPERILYGTPNRSDPLATRSVDAGSVSYGRGLEESVTRSRSSSLCSKWIGAKRTFEKVQKVANALGRHPATIYRWMEGV